MAKMKRGAFAHDKNLIKKVFVHDVDNKVFVHDVDT